MPPRSYRNAPLPQALRLLLEDAGVTCERAARNSGIQLSTLNQILEGQAVPTPKQVKALCRAGGVGRAQRVVALALRARGKRDPYFCGYRNLPGYQALEAWGTRSQRRSSVKLLVPADPAWPFHAHTYWQTYQHLESPCFDPDTGEWDLDCEMWEKVQAALRSGWLEKHRDKSGLYLYSFCTPEDEVMVLEEDENAKGKAERVNDFETGAACN